MIKQFEDEIGNNIKEVRLERGLSQEKLAKMCDISNTTLSAYENGRKIPNLTTIAKIAKKLNVSIERLYYGDDNNSFIKSENNVGKKIVNSIYLLWEQDVISYYSNFESDTNYVNYIKLGSPNGVYLSLDKFGLPIKRFINALNDYRKNKHTYTNPEVYLEMLKDSVANEINTNILNSQRY